MGTGEVIVEILKLILPPLFVIGAVWMVLRELQKRHDRTSMIELRGQTVAKILPLRLNAYERAILFLERISPENLLVRTDASGKHVQAFQKQLLAEIRAEYEHNMAQQLYVSPEGWMELVKAKEQIQTLINNCAKEVPPTANAIDLGRKIIEVMMKAQISPCHHAIGALKSDMQKMLKV